MLPMIGTVFYPVQYGTDTNSLTATTSLILRAFGIFPMVPLEILSMVPLVANGTIGNQRTLNVSGAYVTIGRNVGTNGTIGKPNGTIGKPMVPLVSPMVSTVII